MGKRFEKQNTHSNLDTHKRREKRVLLTTCFLLREALNLDPNPAGLSEPQPLSKLNVIEFLNNVIARGKRPQTTEPFCADRDRAGARARNSDLSKSSL